MSFHNDLIKIIVENREKLQWIIGMYDIEVQTEISMSDFGDIDIYVRGVDVNTQKEAAAIVEVKSHRGLVEHYIKHQLPKYVEKFPAAKQFVAYSKNDSFNFDDIEFDKLK